MNRAITIIAALMLVVSAMIVITIIDSFNLIDKPEQVVPATQVPPTPSQPPATATPAGPTPTAGPARPLSEVGGEFLKQLMATSLPVAGEALDVSTQPLRADQLPPERWQEWPVIPNVSERARAIYQDGLKKGTNPGHFSKIGDCQVIQQYFLGLFDENPDQRLDGTPYENLLPTIKAFAGNWDRVSMAVRTGFNVASVLSTINSDPEKCKPSETPLQCEFRIWNPSIVVISMETWTPDRPTNLYEGYLRQIVEFSISRGALPILATKADNLEGDHSINLAVARVAIDYDIPLWNFWRAANALPNHGLLEDGFHLTNVRHDFKYPETMQYAWPVRNISFVQAFETVWKAVK